MRVSRIMPWALAGLFVAVMLVALGTTSCTSTPKVSPPPHTKNVKCTTKINVDPSDGVDHKAVYVCDGDTLQWDNPHNATFTVHFPGDCPFNPCPDISDSNPRAIKTLPADITVYKYNIIVNTVLHDPHVVGGGG